MPRIRVNPARLTTPDSERDEIQYIDPKTHKISSLDYYYYQEHGITVQKILKANGFRTFKSFVQKYKNAGWVEIDREGRIIPNSLDYFKEDT